MCPFCPSAQESKTDKLSFCDFKKILEKIKSSADLIYLHVLGEPLLHPDIEKILMYCENNNIPLGLTTNGTILSKYQELILNLGCLKKLNISLQCLIQFSSELREKYLDSLIDFLAYREIVNSTTPINLRLWNDKNDVNNIELNNFVNLKLNKFINNSKNIRLSSDDEFIWPSTNLEINDKATNCLGGKKQFAILSDGTICLCCLDYEGKTKLGNILVDNLDKILISPLYQNVIKGFNNRKPIFELCQKCTFRNRFIKK